MPNDEKRAPEQLKPEELENVAGAGPSAKPLAPLSAKFDGIDGEIAPKTSPDQIRGDR